jgi:hypothetical protein
MSHTVKAVIDQDGNVRLLEPITLPASRSALVTILAEDWAEDSTEDPSITIAETALLSEAALATDWLRPEEDQAWSHLQPEQ